MKVYALEGSNAYEGTDIIGVYQTIELAQEAMKEYREKSSAQYDTMRIASFQMNTPLVWETNARGYVSSICAGVEYLDVFRNEQPHFPTRDFPKEPSE